MSPVIKKYEGRLSNGDNVDIIIGLGNSKTISFDDITYYPIYFVKSNKPKYNGTGKCKN